MAPAQTKRRPWAAWMSRRWDVLHPMKSPGPERRKPGSQAGTSSKDRSLGLVILGGTGFIGGHLCDLLLRRGHRVVCVDNLFSFSMRGVEHLSGHERFHFFNRDVSRPIEIAPPVDGVLHLATPADPRLFRTHPVDVARAAGLGTASALDLAREHGCRFLLASSEAVYGEPSEHPQSERTLGSLDPRWVDEQGQVSMPHSCLLREPGSEPARALME
ncbi:MAG: NAD-dependent epimerase/dehydratase family protein [Acidobacteriota bacterium]